MSFLSVRYPDDPDMWTPTRYTLDLPDDLVADLRREAESEWISEEADNADDERWQAERGDGGMPQ